MDPASLPLRDIHLPPGVSAWPPGPLWWLLVLLLALVLGAALWRWRRLAFRRRLLVEHQRIERAFRGHGEPAALARDLCTLLRQALLGYFPRDQVAALQGSAWYEALSGLAGDSRVLPRDLAMTLHEAQLRPRAEFDAGGALTGTRSWLRELPPGGNANA